MALSEDKINLMVEDGLKVTNQLGHFPSFSEYAKARKIMDLKFSEWQIYRAFNGDAGAWNTFQYLVMEKQIKTKEK